MKFPFRSLFLCTVLLSTTFCSKDTQIPNPTDIGNLTTNDKTQVNASPYYPVGFNSQTCSADTTGTGTFLFADARNQAASLGYNVTDADFVSLRNTTTYNPGYSVDANGHVSGTQYDSRANAFSDGMNNQLEEYNYYVYWASLHGSDVQDPEDIKAIIREQFEATIPVRSEEINTLTQNQIQQLNIAAVATRPQLERALALFDALYQCEGRTPYKGTGINTDGTKNNSTSSKDYATEKSTDRQLGSDIKVKNISFKDFLKLRKEGKIQNPASNNVAQRGLLSFLKKAVRVVITVAFYTTCGVLGGIGAGGLLCGAPCAGVGAWVGLAAGFTYGIVKVSRNQCLFGGC